MENAITDPRWQELVARYQHNWPIAMEELLGYRPTEQQKIVLEAAQGVSTHTTVAVANGVGSSHLASAILILRTILYPYAQAYCCVSEESDTRRIRQSYLPMMWDNALKNCPWLDNYFQLEHGQGRLSSRMERFWVGDIRSALAPEELAGACAEHLFYIVLNASEVLEDCFSVIRGALTDKDNGILLMGVPSPDKESGHFYDSHHRFAKRAGNPSGYYTAITLSAEECPLVSPEYLVLAAKRAGGKDTDEYRTRVQGKFSGLKSIMARFPLPNAMTVTMPDNSVWQVPTEFIARHRAAYYAQEHGITFEESLEQYTLPLFYDDSYEIQDWAENNMNWADVEPHATMIRPGEVDYNDGWVNGEKGFMEA